MNVIYCRVKENRHKGRKKHLIIYPRGLVTLVKYLTLNNILPSNHFKGLTWGKVEVKYLSWID